MTTELDMRTIHRLIAVDPGGVHVGVSTWSDHGGYWDCISAEEWTPWEFEDSLRDGLFERWSEVPHLGIAYETFRLRGGAGALQQQGSTFPEVELIGVIRALCRWAEVPLIPVEPSARSAAIQRASALGYQWRAHGHGGHAKDAEAVGICALRLNAEKIRLAAVLP